MGDGQGAGDTEQRVAFVSRRQPQGGEMHGGGRDAGGELLPRLLQGKTLLLLVFAALLQAFAWSQLRGYQLADSVEFMDRAYAVARGDTLDSTGAVRGFGFSTFLLPFFALAEKFELENMRVVVHAVRLLVMLFGLGLVYLGTRVGARIGGRRVGYAAGFFIAINPIFLQYSVDPVSGVAASFFVALGLDLLIVRGGFRRSLCGGLALGAAFMMAYQTILIGAPLVGLLLLRDRWRHTRSWLGALAGLSTALFAQVVLDKVTYGTWGITVGSYLIENTGGVFFTMVAFMGLEDSQWVKDTYQVYLETLSDGAVMAESGERRNLQAPFFYANNLPTMIVWPVLLVGLLGLWRSWRRASWMSSILIVLFLLNAYVTSMKGSKSFRLWLPLLPMIGPLCALGWGALVRVDGPGRTALWRRLASAAVLLGGLALGLQNLYEINTRRYGTYWDAIDYISSQAHQERLSIEARGDEFVRQRVGSAYNWAVFCRSSSDVQVVKFNGHLDQWHLLGPAQREYILAQMGRMDWLVLHGTVLRVSSELTRAINERFEIIASFWDEDTEPTIADVRVLRNLALGQERRPLPAGRRAKRLFEVIEGVDPIAYREYWQLDRTMEQPALLVGEGLDGRQERMQLLGFEYEVLPTNEFGWITYHWYTDTGFDHNYVLVDRVTTLECPWAWQNNRTPGHFTLTTSTWEPGWIVRESYLLMPGMTPFHEEFRPFGGTFRRGDLLPSMLWIHGESPAPDIRAHMLVPADLKTRRALDVESGRPWSRPGLLTSEGYVVSPDHLMQVARFLIPVNDRYRWPDDGGPGPDEAILLAAFQRQQQRLKEVEAERKAAREAGSEGQSGE